MEVIVRNPDGETARKSNGYASVLVTISSIDPVAAWPGMVVGLGGTGFLPGVTVTMGGVTVDWTNSHPGFDDWIGIFRPGDRNENYGTSYDTSRGTAGTVVCTAPTTPGQYEFRYFLNDSFTDIARSNLITVIG